MATPAPLPVVEGLAILSNETVWQGRFPLQVVRFRHRRFDGAMSGIQTWELWRRGRAAALLPYDPWADAVVLIEQFRLPALAAGVDPMMVEVPAGLCDPGEEPEATIAREMREEVGMTPDQIRPIQDIVLTPGGCDERVSLFVGRVGSPIADAEGIIGHAGLATEHEDIRARIWPAARAIDWALEGRFANAVTVVALLWLAARRTEVRAQWLAT
jgi:ADP-ribose pyrophosphatase